MKIILKYVLTYLILILICFGTLFLTSLIPSSSMKENVKESSETLLQDGEKKIFDLKYRKECIFTFTEALMINTAYSIDSETPIKSFLLARKNYIKGQTQIENIDSQYNLGASSNYKNVKTGDIYQTKELYALMHNDNIIESFEYARYWHGYLVILRPLLIIFNYSQIRCVLAILTIISMFTMLALIYKRINLKTACIYLFGFLLINIFIVTQSMNEIFVFLIAIISTIILLLKKEKIKDIFLFFFSIGVITNFIDLLTAPIVTLGIVGTTYFLILQKENGNLKLKEYIIKIIRICLAWGLGYALMWISKWAITQLLLNRDLIVQSITQAIWRSKLPTEITKYSYINVLQRNINFLSRDILNIVIFITIIILLFNIIKNRKREIDIIVNLKNCVPYIFFCILPFIWYLVLQQHSMVHAFFTYRILIVSIINVLIIATKIFKDKE